MKPLLVLLILAVFLLNGCMTQRGWIVPYGKTLDQRREDKEECYKLAVESSGSGVDAFVSFMSLGIWGESTWNREMRIYRKCLRLKGWRWGEIEK